MWPQIVFYLTVLHLTDRFVSIEALRNEPKLVGPFMKDGAVSGNLHGVKGDVYIVSPTEIFVKDFGYDGNTPDAHFWVGKTKDPNEKGILVKSPEEIAGSYNLTKNSVGNVTLKFGQDGVEVVDAYTYLAVWCREAKLSFGMVYLKAPTTDAPPPSGTPKSSSDRLGGNWLMTQLAIIFCLTTISAGTVLKFFNS